MNGNLIYIVCWCFTNSLILISLQVIISLNPSNSQNTPSLINLPLNITQQQKAFFLWKRHWCLSDSTFLVCVHRLLLGHFKSGFWITKWISNQNPVFASLPLWCFFGSTQSKTSFMLLIPQPDLANNRMWVNLLLRRGPRDFGFVCLLQNRCPMLVSNFAGSTKKPLFLWWVFF